MLFGKKNKNEENLKKFGPEYPQRASDEPVNSGQKITFNGKMKNRLKKKEIPEIRCVYAGPEYFEPRDNSVRRPDPKKETPMAPLYGGPKPMPEKDRTPMMMVYAGPGYWNKMPGTIGAEIQKTCNKCLALNPEKAKYCMECGAKLELPPDFSEPAPSADAEQIRCACGVMVSTDRKFCPNCGRIVPQKI